MKARKIERLKVFLIECKVPPKQRPRSPLFSLIGDPLCFRC
ncbi:tRNA lysidine(34) synthetase TilS [Thalassoglobus sp.]